MSESKSAADGPDDRVVRIDVVDADGTAIPGAEVKIYLNGDYFGEQKTAHGRATFQINDPKTEVEVESIWPGEPPSQPSKKEKLAGDYWRFKWDDVHVNPPPPPPQAQPLAAGWYALIGFAGLAVAIYVGYYLLNNLGNLSSYGYGQQAYYVLLVLLGIASAVFLFGVLRSGASMVGTQFGMAIDLGGPVVVGVLVVFGGFYLTKPSLDEFALTVFLRSDRPANEVAQGSILVVDIEGRRDRHPVSPSGEVTIKGIPSRLRNSEIPISLESSSFRIKDPKPAYRIPPNGVIYIDVIPIAEPKASDNQRSNLTSEQTLLLSAVRASLGRSFVEQISKLGNSTIRFDALRHAVPISVTAHFWRDPTWPREMLSLMYIQQLFPSVLIVQSVDAERKAKCTNPVSPRDIGFCDVLQHAIDDFTSRCTPHFSDVNIRMREFRQDPAMYYNTAVNYCHFARFKILLEEMRLVNRPVCQGDKPPSGCVPVNYQSALQMIKYLGELIAAQNYIETPFIPMMLFGRSTESGFEFVQVPLLVVKRGGDGQERASVAVYHDGERYYIPEPDSGSPIEVASSKVLDLVLQAVFAAAH